MRANALRRDKTLFRKSCFPTNPNVGDPVLRLQLSVHRTKQSGAEGGYHVD
jgi:hypothetical protein